MHRSSYYGKIIQEPLTLPTGKYVEHWQDIPILVIGGKGVVVGTAVFVFDLTGRYPDRIRMKFASSRPVLPLPSMNGWIAAKRMWNSAAATSG